jgi:hypothetical protein|tara:strand:+ start:17571 stop:17981 length:411 start_codon:yes stop_codon:yes gene_type:complete
MIKKINRLSLVLGMGGLNGAVSLAALSGLFKIENAFLIAILFMAGPGAIITAVMFEGSVRERMFAALLAGVIATIIVVFAAGMGPKLLGFLNLNILKIVGGVSVLVIGLMIMGLKIPGSVPTLIMLLGIILGIVWR